MESTFHRNRGPASPGWTLADFAERNKLNVKSLAALAREMPLPRPLRTITSCARHPTHTYAYEDLARWYEKARPVPKKDRLALFVCPACGTTTRRGARGPHACRFCDHTPVVRAYKRKVPPRHGAFDRKCSCADCRMFYHGEGTARPCLRLGEAAFVMQFPTQRQAQFHRELGRLSLDLQFIASEVFQRGESLTPTVWARRVRALGVRIHNKRGLFVHGPVGAEDLGQLAELIESLDD